MSAFTREDRKVEFIPVTEVKPGDDVWIESGWLMRVTAVTPLRVGYVGGPTWGDAVQLLGCVGIVRFRHEYVTVVREPSA